MVAAATELASTIAAKSPVATLGVKTLLNYARDHSTDDALRFGLTWNAAMLQAADTATAATAFVTGTEPRFGDLVPLRGGAADGSALRLRRDTDADADGGGEGSAGGEGARARSKL